MVRFDLIATWQLLLFLSTRRARPIFVFFVYLFFIAFYLPCSASPRLNFPLEDPVLVAIRSGDLASLRADFSRGLSVEKRIGGWTLLMHAAFHGQARIIRFLVSKGADVNAKDREGRTPLYCSILHTREVATYDREVIGLLITHGADLNLRDSNGNTALIFAIDTTLIPSCVIPNIKPDFRMELADLVELLLKLGTDISAKNRRGMTAFAVASEPHMYHGAADVSEMQANLRVFGPVIEILASRNDSLTPGQYRCVGQIGAFDVSARKHVEELLSLQMINYRLETHGPATRVLIDRDRLAEARVLLRKDAQLRKYLFYLIDLSGSGDRRFQEVKA